VADARTTSTSSGDRVLVTGATGYVARFCIAELLRLGHRVRATVRALGQASDVRAALRSDEAGAQLEFVEAELTRDAGWSSAVDGCRYVLHVAAPLPMRSARDPSALTGPTRDGTRRVLRAAIAARVERVVLTSSAVAVGFRRETAQAPNAPATECDWSDASAPGATPYLRAKTLAERAAWELVEARDERERLTTILPGTVIGPLLGGGTPPSVQAIRKMLSGAMPLVPRLSFPFVDVRDIAALHVRALTEPAVAGERVLATGPTLWLVEVAKVLHRRLGDGGRRVSTRIAPDWLTRLVAFIDAGSLASSTEVGKRRLYSSEKAQRLLSWAPRPSEATIVDCAASLIREGLVPGSAPAHHGFRRVAGAPRG
jgi:dihydroflavonol-4-reductase